MGVKTCHSPTTSWRLWDYLYLFFYFEETNIKSICSRPEVASKVISGAEVNQDKSNRVAKIDDCVLYGFWFDRNTDRHTDTVLVAVVEQWF